jgi:hypothetical protein
MDKGTAAVPSAEQAAGNNAAWCHAVCKAHGGEGEWGEGWWRNRLPSPLFYPNLVTLTPGPAEAQVAAVRELLRAGLPGEFGVKDSFGALDLSPLGFRVLFEAEWLGRPAGGPEAPEASVRRVTTEAELAAWEAGWQGGASGPRLFLPKLLEDPEIAFLGVWDGGGVVAGLAVNRSRRGFQPHTTDDGRPTTDDRRRETVVGVSNIFLPAENGERWRAALLGAAEAVFPGLPLVGYEHGADLRAMQALGFESLGGLRVWTAPAARPEAG